MTRVGRNSFFTNLFVSPSTILNSASTPNYEINSNYTYLTYSSNSSSGSVFESYNNEDVRGGWCFITVTFECSSTSILELFSVLGKSEVVSEIFDANTLPDCKTKKVFEHLDSI